MIQIKTKQDSLNFPLEIFTPSIAESFRELAQQHSIPVDYLGTTAIWMVASLTGNMYETKGVKAKPIVYCMMLGPSSLGKSVAHRLLCDDVVSKLEAHNVAEFKRKLKEFEEHQEHRKRNRDQEIPNIPYPIRKIRTATNATTEAIIQYASTNPAGFGMYFDEGKAMYSGGAYKKDNNSVDFWNNAWNGMPFNELRVDHARERYVEDPAISVLAGMQTDRIAEMFSKDTMESGLFNRFLFTASGYVHLNEEVDHFAESAKVCQEWRDIIVKLFNQGMYFTKPSPDDPFGVTSIPFTDGAKLLFNSTAKEITRQANELIAGLREGDGTKNIISYWGKLFAYFKRFHPILAVMRNPVEPVIDERVVQDALKLYYYYRNQAKSILHSLIAEQETSLNANELKLFTMLPDRFTAAEAEQVAEALKFSRTYFYNTFRRKYSRGFLRKENGFYMK